MKGWGSLEAAFFPGALPPTIAALSLFGNWTLEVSQNPPLQTSQCIPKKQPVVELESRWPPAVPHPRPAVTHRHLQRGCSESSSARRIYTQAYFLFLPTSLGLWPQIRVPQEAPLKQEWPSGVGGSARETHKHPLFLGRAPSGAGRATTQQGMLVRATCGGSQDPNRWSFREAGLGES